MTKGRTVAAAAVLVAGLLGALIWSGYPRGVGPGWVSNNGWQLDAMSIDGTTLTVSTNFGGVASGCTRFEEWTWSESDDRVDIEARLWQAIAPQACTSDGAFESLTIQLEQPLGNRDLTGCGEPECLPTVARAGLFVINSFDANDQGVRRSCPHRAVVPFSSTSRPTDPDRSRISMRPMGRRAGFG